MAQATKSPEAVKSSVLVKTQVLEKGEEVVANVSESLINTWTEGLCLWNHWPDMGSLSIRNGILYA